MTKPFFCVVEGIDGCGKTGVVAWLAKHLAAQGRDVIATREPGGTQQGEAIRALILSGADQAWSPYSELLLMTAARTEHVNRVILPALERGASVVSDRYVGSTLAYQGAGRGLEEAFILSLHQTAVGDLWPDLTIILDLDVETGLSRSRKRLNDGAVDEGRFEALTLDFHHRIRQSFLAQAGAHPERHVVIDASGTPEEVRHRVTDALDSWITTRP